MSSYKVEANNTNMPGIRVLCVNETVFVSEGKMDHLAKVMEDYRFSADQVAAGNEMVKIKFDSRRGTTMVPLNRIKLMVDIEQETTTTDRRQTSRQPNRQRRKPAVFDPCPNRRRSRSKNAKAKEVVPAVESSSSGGNSTNERPTQYSAEAVSSTPQTVETVGNLVQPPKVKIMGPKVKTMAPKVMTMAPKVKTMGKKVTAMAVQDGKKKQPHPIQTPKDSGNGRKRAKRRKSQTPSPTKRQYSQKTWYKKREDGFTIKAEFFHMRLPQIGDVLDMIPGETLAREKFEVDRLAQVVGDSCFYFAKRHIPRLVQVQYEHSKRKKYFSEGRFCTLTTDELTHLQEEVMISLDHPLSLPGTKKRKRSLMEGPPPPHLHNQRIPSKTAAEKESHVDNVEWVISKDSQRKGNGTQKDVASMQKPNKRRKLITARPSPPCTPLEPAPDQRTEIVSSFERDPFVKSTQQNKSSNSSDKITTGQRTSRESIDKSPSDMHNSHQKKTADIASPSDKGSNAQNTSRASLDKGLSVIQNTHQKKTASITSPSDNGSNAQNTSRASLDKGLSVIQNTHRNKSGTVKSSDNKIATDQTTSRERIDKSPLGIHNSHQNKTESITSLSANIATDQKTPRVSLNSPLGIHNSHQDKPASITNSSAKIATDQNTFRASLDKGLSIIQNIYQNKTASITSTSAKGSNGKNTSRASLDKELSSIQNTQHQNKSASIKSGNHKFATGQKTLRESLFKSPSDIQKTHQNKTASITSSNDKAASNGQNTPRASLDKGLSIIQNTHQNKTASITNPSDKSQRKRLPNTINVTESMQNKSTYKVPNSNIPYSNTSKNMSKVEGPSPDGAKMPKVAAGRQTKLIKTGRAASFSINQEDFGYWDYAANRTSTPDALLVVAQKHFRQNISEDGRVNTVEVLKRIQDEFGDRDLSKQIKVVLKRLKHDYRVLWTMKKHFYASDIHTAKVGTILRGVETDLGVKLGPETKAILRSVLGAWVVKKLEQEK